MEESSLSSSQSIDHKLSSANKEPLITPKPYESKSVLF